MYWRDNGVAVITRGWAEVLDNNNLVAGAISVFELIRRDILVKLSIYHA